MFGIHQQLDNPIGMVPYKAQQLGATTFQIFLRNNRNMKRRFFSNEEVGMFNVQLLSSGITSYVVHAPYVLNMCTDDKDKRKHYVDVIADDMKLMQRLAGVKYYVIHPGSSLELEPDVALNNVYTVLKSLTDCVGSTHISVELMAGAGTQMLRTYEQVDYLKNLCDDLHYVSFCFDTCHVFASGNDIFSTYNLLKDCVSVVHLNDSVGMFESRVDRHANLGSGCIGSDNLIEFAQHVTAHSKDIPIILETPISGQLEDYVKLSSALS